MADKFRRMLDQRTGLGGVHCYCCNKYRGRGKGKRARLRRIARRVIKTADLREMVF